MSFFFRLAPWVSFLLLALAAGTPADDQDALKANGEKAAKASQESDRAQPAFVAAFLDIKKEFEAVRK